MPNIIITGGSSGIGLSIAKYFASSSASPTRIAILDINATIGSSVVSSLAADYPNTVILFKKCDVSSWEEQAQVFKDLYDNEFEGKIDIVVANAGVSERGYTTLVEQETGGEGPSKPDLSVLDINLSGVIYSVKLGIYYMDLKPAAEAERGLIICTASNAGLYALATAPLYAASKFGVVGLVRSAALLVEGKKIRINALAPAVVETNIAPKELYRGMVVTPMETLIRAVDGFVKAGMEVTGQVAEVHGGKVTVREAHGFVDEDTERNLGQFRGLGWA
ncbi:hypothetical protein QBC40DRAFT_318623 [Triangularia verruculosa]|uniref:Uncharacterized protein n=1 Tax=Triangularia verruculosa TaxID=2587418 RepID=A0AAN6XRD3_9PEZI|nr:hypothetical protein QBC40DRAFT_318623 [Triangularia verruculosa]